MKIVKLEDINIMSKVKEMSQEKCESISVRNLKELKEVQIDTISISVFKDKKLSTIKTDEITIACQNSLSDENSLPNTGK